MISGHHFAIKTKDVKIGVPMTKVTAISILDILKHLVRMHIAVDWTSNKHPSKEYLVNILFSFYPEHPLFK